jgi:single-strand DNA-binding protein
MASGVNKVILVGNLGKDPEVRYTQGGKAVCTLRLAMTERRKKPDSDAWEDHTEWMDVVTWDKTAENAGQYLAKGRQIFVEGRIQTRQYKDKDGNDRYKTEVVASQVIFLGGKDADKPSGSHVEKKPKESPAPDAPGFVDDDLPF